MAGFLGFLVEGPFGYSPFSYHGWCGNPGLAAGDFRGATIQGSRFEVRFVRWFGRNRIETIWVFPKIGVPQNGWFRMENLIKMDDLGVPSLF